MTKLSYIPYGVTQDELNVHLEQHYVAGNVQHVEFCVPSEMLELRKQHLLTYHQYYEDRELPPGASDELDRVINELNHRANVDMYSKNLNSSIPMLDTNVEFLREQLNDTVRMRDELVSGIRRPAGDARNAYYDPQLHPELKLNESPAIIHHDEDEMPAGHTWGMPNAKWWSDNPETAAMVKANNPWCHPADDIPAEVVHPFVAPYAHLDLRTPTERLEDQDALDSEIMRLRAINALNFPPYVDPYETEKKLPGLQKVVDDLKSSAAFDTPDYLDAYAGLDWGVGVMPLAMDVFTVARADLYKPTLDEMANYLIDSTMTVLRSIEAASEQVPGEKVIDTVAFLLVDLFVLLAVAYPDAPVKMLNQAIDMAGSKAFGDYIVSTDSPTLY